MVKTETSGLTATIFKVVAGGRVWALKKKREQILVKNDELETKADLVAKYGRLKAQATAWQIQR